MENFLKELHINSTGKYVADKYVIDIDNFDSFSALYNKLEQSEKVNKDSDESFFNMDEAHVVYYSEEFTLILNGDLSNDEYQLSVQESIDEDGE